MLNQNGSSVDKAITFLGRVRKSDRNPYGYAETWYTYNNQRVCFSPFVAEAIHQIYHPRTLYVVATKEAKAEHFDDLVQRLSGAIEPTPILIPTPQSDTDIWQIFKEMTQEQYISDEDHVVFDFTNGFRSIPFLALLASSYLQVARNIDIVGITYGEFFPGNEETPIRELTTLLQLFEWTIATDAFLKYGRADDLTKLTESSVQFQPLGESLHTLTAALQTSRPAETLETAYQLQTSIKQVQNTPTVSAQPFTLLLNRIAAEYGKLAHAQPANMVLAREVVEKQLHIIEWYIDKRMFVQALTAAREWMVSLLLMYTQQDLFSKSRRSQAEKLIRQTASSLDETLVPHLGDIRAVWQQTTSARNSVAHHGWNPTAQTAQEIEDVARTVCSQLRGLLR